MAIFCRFTAYIQAFYNYKYISFRLKSNNMNKRSYLNNIIYALFLINKPKKKLILKFYKQKKYFIYRHINMR